MSIIINQGGKVDITNDLEQGVKSSFFLGGKRGGLKRRDDGDGWCVMMMMVMVVVMMVRGQTEGVVMEVGGGVVRGGR